jgi:beta-glucosidase
MASRIALCLGGRIDSEFEFLRVCVGAMKATISNGADVRGYFSWSPLDNFEWEQGHRNGFGRIYVDDSSLRYTPKSSFR